MKKQLFSNEGVTKQFNFGKSNCFLNEGVMKRNLILEKAKKKLNKLLNMNTPYHGSTPPVLHHTFAECFFCHSHLLILL